MSGGAALAVWALAGCTSNASDAQAVPEPTTASITATATASAEPTAASRGRSIDVASIDPCTLVTPDEQAQLKVIEPLGTRDKGAGVTACTFVDASGGITGFTVIADASKGIAGFRAPGPTKTVTETSMGGFSGVTVAQTIVHACSVVLDASEGQTLTVTATDDRVADDQLCERPLSVMPIVVANLPA